jgi:hypothetical protein
VAGVATLFGSSRSKRSVLNSNDDNICLSLSLWGVGCRAGSESRIKITLQINNGKVGFGQVG